MRWILAAVAVLALIGAWFASSGTGFGLLLFIGICAALAAALAFAHARISGNAQPEVITDGEIEALRAAVRRQRAGDTTGAPAAGRPARAPDASAAGAARRQGTTKGEQAWNP